MKTVWIKALLLLLALTEIAQAQNLRRLTGRDDLLGWEAVGRLDLNGQGFCTGTLIAPELVLTAAHCVYDPRTHQLWPVEQIQFRAGLRDGVAIAERQGLQIVAHPGYQSGAGVTRENVLHDVALIRLAQPITSRDADPFVLFTGQGAGDEISVTSYGVDRADALQRQRHCRLLASQGGLNAFDCDITFGSSGAPVFTHVSGRGRILSIVSAGGRIDGEAIGYGMALPDRVAELKAMLRRMPVSSFNRSQTGTSHSSGAKFVRPNGG